MRCADIRRRFQAKFVILLTSGHLRRCKPMANLVTIHMHKLFGGLCNASERDVGHLNVHGLASQCDNSSGLCFHTGEYAKDVDADDWWGFERIVLERFAGMSCSHHQHHLCKSQASIVVLPSLWAHCGPPQAAVLDGSHELHDMFWHLARTHVQPSQLIVTHARDSWDTPYSNALLATLAKHPAEFVRRVVFVTMESPLQLREATPSLAQLDEHAMPRFLVVPPAIPVRHLVKPDSERLRRPFAILFQGRVVTATRAAAYWQLRSHSGSHCFAIRDDADLTHGDIRFGVQTCTVCMPGLEEACLAKRRELEADETSLNTLTYVAVRCVTRPPLSFPRPCTAAKCACLFPTVALTPSRVLAPDPCARSTLCFASSRHPTRMCARTCMLPSSRAASPSSSMVPGRTIMRRRNGRGGSRGRGAGRRLRIEPTH